MKAEQVIYTWDYHHGQATRVILGGIPLLHGSTMREKHAYFLEHCDYIRTSLMQEPRGHKNMLGAVLTDPGTSDGDIGMLFLNPHGYFEMCGDSLLSGAAALFDSGMFGSEDPNGDTLVRVDTLAGRIDVHVRLQEGKPVAITYSNVASCDLGPGEIDAAGIGPVPVMFGYGGLLYAFVEAQRVGIPSLKNVNRIKLLDTGTRLWHAARTLPPTPIGSGRGIEPRQVDLVTLWEPIEDVIGTRVANFYAPYTMGRTPSGTGLAARVAIEVASGRLEQGETFIHESPLGLRFLGTALEVEADHDLDGLSWVIPSITARSYLMGVSHWMLHSEDPYRHGFEL